MNQNAPKDFTEFLKFFPVVELPVILTEDLIIDFSKMNTPLNLELTEKFILPYLKVTDREFLEIIPCFSIPDTHDFHAIVFYEADVLSHQYNIATYTKQGAFISGKALCGTLVKDEMITKSVATIDEDWTINIVGGEAHSSQRTYEASNSKAFNLEMMPDGKIIFPLDQ